MITNPNRAGNAVQRALSIKGAARINVFWNVFQLPNAAFQIEPYTAKGFVPANVQKMPKRINPQKIAPNGSAIDSRVLRQE
jgi:hypothetical protein